MKKIYTAVSDGTVAVTAATVGAIVPAAQSVGHVFTAGLYASALLSQEAKMGFLIRQVTLEKDFRASCTLAGIDTAKQDEILAKDPMSLVGF